MSQVFEYCVFIGRFQPFHLAHHQLILKALQQAEQVVVVLGSHLKSPDIKNPWSSVEREAMIRAAFSPEDNQRIKCVAVRDDLYRENVWITDLQEKINEATDWSDKVALIGHEHDRSSYYLNLFPQWTRIEVKNIDNLPHATDIRRLYFTLDASYKNSLHTKTAEYLEQFKNTQKFAYLKEEYDFLREYKTSWEGAPFPPTFVTVDAVVIRSGHILVVRRRGGMGKGLIALPGGFLNQFETTRDGAIRELKEETAIKLSKEELTNAICDHRLFDHPDRSLRGRTLTHAFLLNLKSGALPKVKGEDDADKAWWLPLADFATREEEFFEDHFHIVNYFCSKY